MATVHVVDHGGIRQVRLHRPPVNALGIEEYDAVRAAITWKAAGPRLIVVRAVGEAWSAGQDLREIEGLDRAGTADYLECSTPTIAAAARCSVPVITAVHGAAAGAAALLVAVSDVVLAMPDVWLSFSEARLGMPIGLALLDGVPRPVAFHAMSTALDLPRRGWQSSGWSSGRCPWVISTQSPASGWTSSSSCRTAPSAGCAPRVTPRDARAYEGEVAALVAALRD